MNTWRGWGSREQNPVDLFPGDASPTDQGPLVVIYSYWIGYLSFASSVIDQMLVQGLCMFEGLPTTHALDESMYPSKMLSLDGISKCSDPRTYLPFDLGLPEM